MPQNINYQVVINTIGLFLAISVPIGIVLGITEKLANLFFSMVFGERNIKL